MAQIAWDIEREDLGLVAGPQDRVIQALGGLQYMDFSGPDDIGVHESLDPDLLPPLLVAWPKEPGTPSGDVHRALWERWSAGDSVLRQSLAGFAEIADTGRQALLDRDTTTFCNAVDANFDLRRSIFTLDDEQAALVTAARAAGARRNSVAPAVQSWRFRGREPTSTPLPTRSDQGPQSAAEFASRSPRRKASRASSP